MSTTNEYPCKVCGKMTQDLLVALGKSPKKETTCDACKIDFAKRFCATFEKRIGPSLEKRRFI